MLLNAPVTLRPAQPADWPAIAALLESHGLPLAGAREHLATFLVAVHDARVVGVAGAEVHGDSALLRSVAVDDALRGRGIGRHLVERLLQEAARRDIGIRRIVVTHALHQDRRRGHHFDLEGWARGVASRQLIFDRLLQASHVARQIQFVPVAIGRQGHWPRLAHHLAIGRGEHQLNRLALTQANEARMHILGLMKQSMSAPSEISTYAPRLITMKINPEKIRDVIGKGGAVIRALTEETGTVIDINDDGTVTIASVSAEAGALAKKRIEDITAEVEVGKVYDGTVLRLLDFGAIVQILPGKDGLLHISQIANERVNQVSDYLKEGQAVRVKVLEADEKGRVRLSMKAAAEAAPAQQ